jgi:hypothetical protein
MYKVKSLTKTCHACPSQWEGKLDDGRDLYIRFRWGWLTLSVAGKKVIGLPHGDKFAGIIDLETVDKLTGDLFDFSEV